MGCWMYGLRVLERGLVAFFVEISLLLSFWKRICWLYIQRCVRALYLVARFARLDSRGGCPHIISLILENPGRMLCRLVRRFCRSLIWRWRRRGGLWSGFRRTSWPGSRMRSRSCWGGWRDTLGLSPGWDSG